MTTNSYITLTDSAASRSKRFGVISDGFIPVKDKTTTLNRAVNGGIDIAVGGIYEEHKMQILVSASVADSNYGTLGDLEYFYTLNNPNGSPSNLITMIDHFGTSHTVYFIGQFQRQTLSAVIEGNSSYFIVAVDFQVVS
jgi:hypothetical protein